MAKGLTAMWRAGVLAAMFALFACTSTCRDALETAGPLPPPGEDEPAYDPAVHTSLWHDDFSAYVSMDDMRNGRGAHKWLGTAWNRWSLNTGGLNRTKYIRHDFQPAGEYGDEIWADQDVLQGRDPNVVIMTMWIRNTGTYYTGKVTVFKPGDDHGRWVLGQGSAGPSPHPEITRTYWDADNWPYPALDPSEAQDPYDATGIEFNRDGVQCGAPQSWWGFKQNRNWGSFPITEHWNDGEWHRWTISWARSGGSGACGDGKGRLEYWWDGVKVLEGLAGRCLPGHRRNTLLHAEVNPRSLIARQSAWNEPFPQPSRLSMGLQRPRAKESTRYPNRCRKDTSCRLLVPKRLRRSS